MAWFFALFFASLAFGSYEECLHKARSTLEVLQCQEREFQKVDRRLNQAYQRALLRLPPKKRRELRTIQRLWIRYKEAKCDYFYDAKSGRGGLEEKMECLIQESKRRAKELENL